MIRFYLLTKGKHRGYTLRHELTGAAGKPIQGPAGLQAIAPPGDLPGAKPWPAGMAQRCAGPALQRRAPRPAARPAAWGGLGRRARRLEIPRRHLVEFRVRAARRAPAGGDDHDHTTADQNRQDAGRRSAVLCAAHLELGAKKVPERITTEEAAQKVTDWIGQQCKVLIARAEREHEKEKKPYLDGGRIVDGFFLARIKRLGDVLGLDRKTRTAATVMGRVQQFYDLKKAEQRRREEAERRRAAEARVREAAEARRLAAEAQRSEAAGDRTTAVELTQMAERAETNAALAAVRAQAPPAPVAIRGEYGSTAFAVERWDYEVEDPAAVPLGYLTIDDEAVRQAIAEGVRAIPGLRIFPFDRFTIKRC
jgi:hypothetical protein